MKQILCCMIAISLAVCFGPLPIYAQDASNFQEPGTGALKQVKTTAQADQDAEKPKDTKEEPPSTPLNTSVSSSKQTVSQMTNRPEVSWVYNSKPDASRSLFAKSIAERMQEGTLQGPVSNTLESSSTVVSSTGPIAVTEPSLTDTTNTFNPSASPDLGSPTSLPSPSGSTSAPVHGLVTRPASAPVTNKPASQPAPVSGLDQKTLSLLPAVVFAANVNGGGQPGASMVAGPTALSAPKEIAAAKAEEGPKNVRGVETKEESVRRLGQRGTAVEKLAGGMPKGGTAKSSLLSDGQSAQTGWFDTLRDRVNRNNVSDMKEREAESDQLCVSFADTDGIAKMIEKSSEKAAGLSEDHPRVLYAYGQDPGNIVFITVIQLDSAGQPQKAARLFADGRVQAFDQLAKQDLLGKVFEGEPVPPNEVLFTKSAYRITGVLKSETISQFFLDHSRGAARGPCPKAFSKK